MPANNACNSLIIDVEKPVKDEIGVELYIERIASLVGRTVNSGQQWHQMSDQFTDRQLSDIVRRQCRSLQLQQNFIQLQQLHWAQYITTD